MLNKQQSKTELKKINERPAKKYHPFPVVYLVSGIYSE